MWFVFFLYLSFLYSVLSFPHVFSCCRLRISPGLPWIWWAWFSSTNLLRSRMSVPTFAGKGCVAGLTKPDQNLGVSMKVYCTHIPYDTQWYARICIVNTDLFKFSQDKVQEPPTTSTIVFWRCFAAHHGVRISPGLSTFWRGCRYVANFLVICSTHPRHFERSNYFIRPDW